MTKHKADPALFAQPTLSTLRNWRDFELENQGWRIRRSTKQAATLIRQSAGTGRSH